MIDMLRAVIEGGTASRLRYAYHLTGDIGGKTGTTNNNSDGWFLGITPDWSVVAGSEVRIVTSILIIPLWVKVLQWLCLYGLTICNVFMPTSV